MKKIISLEGGWAGGKTSILKELQANNEKVFCSIVPLIYEMKGRETYSPRDNPEEFTNLFLQLKDQQFNDALLSNANTMYFDRVFFAPIVLRKFFHLEVPGVFYDLAKRVNIHEQVFLVEPIPFENHKNGWPRKFFSYEESLKYHSITRDVITELGYSICVVPYSSSIKERAEFIQNILKVKEGRS
ncbi:MAG: AAA family ATPase [Candidatus Kuenenia sp.]|nr:AAA family ATPase [Candidatus Kuenenia hertensis]